MSRQAARGDTRRLRPTLDFALRLAAYIAVPAAVGLVALPSPIVRVLFQRGRFGAEDTAATARRWSGYAVGLLAFSGARIAAQAFYALGTSARRVLVGSSRSPSTCWPRCPHASAGAQGLALASSLGRLRESRRPRCGSAARLGLLGGRALALAARARSAASAPLALWCVSCGTLAPAGRLARKRLAGGHVAGARGVCERRAALSAPGARRRCSGCCAVAVEPCPRRAVIDSACALQVLGDRPGQGLHRGGRPPPVSRRSPR